MKLRMDYGKDGIWLEFPERVFMVGKLNVKSLENPEEKLMESLRHPVDSPPLHDLAVGRKRACIVISDNTRPVPNEFLLNGIISEIEDGVEIIDILIANGIHEKLNETAIEELVGSDIATKYRVINHDAFDMENLEFLGKTERDLPIYVNKIYLTADLKILTGLIEPHFMAGYSGGRKSICPGISGYETVKYFHSPMLLESPRSDNCIIEGNPVHEEALFIAKTAGVDFIVNVTLDFEKRITGVFAGDLERAWLEGVRFASTYLEYPVDRQFKVVITSNGGYPLDRNYYQTVKGLVASARLVKEGGVIIILSECRDGLGSEHFKENLALLRKMGLDDYITHISKVENFTVDQWEVEELVKVLRKVSKIFMYSEGLNEEEFKLSFTEKIDKDDILKIVEKYSDDYEDVAIMPYGPYVIPMLQN